jgi:hypothetical protein
MTSEATGAAFDEGRREKQIVALSSVAASLSRSPQHRRQT